jgi:hypothetical protein
MAKKDKKNQQAPEEPVDVSDELMGDLERQVVEFTEAEKILKSDNAGFEKVNADLKAYIKELEKHLREITPRCEALEAELAGRRTERQKIAEFVVPETLKVVKGHGLETIENTEAIAKAAGMTVDDVAIRLEAAALKNPHIKRNLGTEDDPVICWEVYARDVWTFLGVEFVPG